MVVRVDFHRTGLWDLVFALSRVQSQELTPPVSKATSQNHRELNRMVARVDFHRTHQVLLGLTVEEVVVASQPRRHRN
jgi:hypothetical protein